MTKVLPMHKLMLLFRRPTSIEGFETAWSAEFVPSAEQMPGIRRVAVSRAVESLAGPADLYLVHEFFFDSLAPAPHAMASAPPPSPAAAAHPLSPPPPPDARAAFIERRGVRAEILHLPVETPTVEDAARAVGTHPDRIVKSLLFLVDRSPTLVIACGASPVSRRRVAAHFHLRPKRIKPADPEATLSASGY